MKFKVGDIVDVGREVNKIRGVITRIYSDNEGNTTKIEIRRPSGIHNEYIPEDDSKKGDGFNYIKKVEV